MYRRIYSIMLFVVILGSMPFIYVSYLFDLGNKYTYGTPDLEKFGSYYDMLSFLSSRDVGQPYYYEPRMLVGTRIQTFSALEDKSAGASDYSTTNIQVEGVDEADILKVDGRYIYLAKGDIVRIIKAYPPEDAEISAVIDLNSTVIGLFINEERLVVFTQNYSYWRSNFEISLQERVQVRIFDVQVKENPVLENEIILDGFYFNSRMIDGHVYVVTTSPVYVKDENIILPTIIRNNVSEDIEATDIYYSETDDLYHTYTSIVSIDVESGRILHETFLLGYSTCLYVSQSNIFIATPKYENGTQRTEIHRVKIDNGNITYEASGKVPGYVLNQFSMDEYEETFRIATTSTYFQEMFVEVTSTNNLYVLNLDLDVIGSVENLAPNEQIYSARFMRTRCYLVTFKKVDPFFVIDLEDPFNPEVLGKLKIPGYSNYLHPYSENVVIGIGKDTVEAEEGDFAWYQGLKLSLYDVSEVDKPREKAVYIIGDRGTESPVLQDHKALLFNKDRNLLVIPVLLAEIDTEKHPDEVPPYVHGDYVWQGAYVFTLNETTIELKGGITHLKDESELIKSGYYFSSTYSIVRSLYIDNYLYTVSEGRIKINSLENLAEIRVIEIL